MNNYVEMFNDPPEAREEIERTLYKAFFYAANYNKASNLAYAFSQTEFDEDNPLFTPSYSEIIRTDALISGFVPKRYFDCETASVFEKIVFLWAVSHYFICCEVGFTHEDAADRLHDAVERLMRVGNEEFLDACECDANENQSIYQVRYSQAA